MSESSVNTPEKIADGGGAIQLFEATERLDFLRRLMRQHNISAVIVPTSDAHNSEYVCEHDKRRAYISGFDGSAGTAVVTLDQAFLWTDGRYFFQALAQLDASAGWTLMKDRLKETPSVEAWLASKLPAGSKVGFDPLTMTVDAVKRLRSKLVGTGIALTDNEEQQNLVDLVWQADKGGQPPMPLAPLRIHPMQHAGKSVHEKLSALRAVLAEEGCTAIIITALDEIAWLFNVRGADVDCNPVTLAYGIVTAHSAVLHVDGAKMKPDVSHHLACAGVSVSPYDGVFDAVRHLATSDAKAKVWVDPASCSWAVYACASPAVFDTKPSPVTLMKALKNSAEIDGMRSAHVRDGCALTTFLAWLQAAVVRKVDLRTGKSMVSPETALTEYSVAAVLDGMRANLQGHVSPSFETIAGYGSNGAIIHYRPREEASAVVGDAGIFLLDSGGQYVDGTTDVTRTLHFGEPTAWQKRCYTAVLKGHIALATARFPAGTSGVALDAIARTPVWAAGLDYRHGTGHGVGAALNVHEGPQGLATVARNSYDGGMQAGMTISNEPGYYEDGQFGIRIETVLIAVEASDLSPQYVGDKPFLCFETLTVTPIGTQLVDAAALTESEKAWLNTYNTRCRTVLAPLLTDAWALEYLSRETEPVM